MGSVDTLFVAALIAAIPSISIAVLGFTLRRSGDISSLLAERKSTADALERMERDLRDERDKRDVLEKAVYELPGEIADEYVKREDFVRNAGQIDHKLDALSRRIEALRPPTTDPTP